MFPRRKRSQWKEGGKHFRRRGMRIEEVVRCHGCGEWHPAVDPRPCGVVIPFRERKDKGESR